MFHDVHMHSKFSTDSDANLDEIVKVSKEKGLSGIYITDHEDIGAFPGTTDFIVDVPEYVKAIKELSKKYTTDDFSIGVGIEMGMMPHIMDEYKKVLESSSVDFCIGSVHYIDMEDIYLDEYFIGKDLLETYENYLKVVYENLNLVPHIDALGHMDYIIRYATRYANNYNIKVPDFVSDKYEEMILDYLIKNEIALEVNTCAYRYGLSEPNPSYRILQKYFDKGGRLITTGSDAHKPEQIALAYDIVMPKLKKIGFDSYFIYKNRTPIAVSL